MSVNQSRVRTAMEVNTILNMAVNMLLNVICKVVKAYRQTEEFVCDSVTVGWICHVTNALPKQAATVEELKSFSDSSRFMLKLLLAFIPMCNFNSVARLLACCTHAHTHTIYVFIHFLHSLFNAIYSSPSLDV